MIYEPLFISHHPIPIVTLNYFCTENFRALALVSKKAYSQASIAFYSRNTFILGNLRSNLDIDAAHSIRKLLSFAITFSCFMDNTVCDVEDRGIPRVEVDCEFNQERYSHGSRSLNLVSHITRKGHYEYKIYTFQNKSKSPVFSH